MEKNSNKKIDNYARWSIRFRKHWSPRYLKNRIKEFWFRRANPEYPWLTADAINILKTIIQSTDTILEFGSGRSTVWMAKKARKIISFEDNEPWFFEVKKLLNETSSDVEYYLIKNEDPDYEVKLCEAIRKIDNDSIDICLVDGCTRGLSALESIPKIRNGGILIIDNVNWFLPSNTLSPSSVRKESEISREFIELFEMISNWRHIWTSNGVTDTAFYFKPV